MKHEFYIEIDNERTVEVTNTIKVGRGVASPRFVAIDDRTISQNHCLIAIKENAENPCFWIWDLGSKNKTIVNGLRKLDGSSSIESDKGCPVYHGDFALIGTHKINFLISRITNEMDGTL